MSTLAKFTGWVQGRNHAPTPIEITGHPLPYTTLTDVRVTGYFPALQPPEIAFTFPELAKGDFTIGSAIEITIAEVPKPAVAAEAAAIPTDPADFQTDSPESQAEAEPVVTTEAVTTTVEAGPALVAEANTNEVAG